MALPFRRGLRRGSPEDIDVQIAARVREAIRSGRLAPGATTPSVREAARYYGVTPNTVSRAYVRLVRAGCLTALPRRGYIVARKPRAHETYPHRRIGALVATLRELGEPQTEIRQALLAWAKALGTPKR